MSKQFVGFGSMQYGCTEGYATFKEITSYWRMKLPRAVRNLTFRFSGFARPTNFTTPTEIATPTYEVITTFERMDSTLTTPIGPYYAVTAGPNNRKWHLVPSGTVVDTNPVGWLPAGDYLVRHYVNTLTSNATTINGELGQLASDSASFPLYGNIGGQLGTAGKCGCKYNTTSTIAPGTYNRTGNAAIEFTAANTNGFCPAAVYGEWADDQHQIGSIAGWGDSITQGVGDATMTTQPMSGLGWLSRGINYRAPFFNGSTGGNGVEFYLGQYQYNWIERAGMAEDNDIDVIFLATNDLNNGASAAQVISWLKEFYSIRRKMNPRRRLIGGTVLPRLSSTNGYIDAAGQSELVPGFWAKAIEVNRWLRTESQLDYLLDFANLLCPDGSTFRPTIIDVTTQATGSPSTTSIPVAAGMTTDQYRGYSCLFNNALRLITGNTATTLTVQAFAGAPVAGDTIQIVRPVVNDGIHPSPWGHYWMSQLVENNWNEFLLNS